ncbi:TlpA family protein disulfide reductase [bacterium]|nr:TlpA family protein disulfide reductase [bacterium]
MKSVIISVITFLLVLTVPFSAGCGEDSGKVDDSTKKAKPAETTTESTGSTVKAADFSLLDTNGKPVKLSDYTGKVVLLDFWATWCPPCVKEIPHFNELSKEYGDKGLVVLGISTDRDGVTAVEKFQQERFSIDYTVVMFDQETFSTYQSYLPKKEQGGIPFTFIIDREGVIRDHFVGYRDKDVFVDAIKPLL